MIAALYARKSTEQTGTAEEAKSVTRQIDHARAYAVMKGWTVAEAHVYVDDGISGAEFAKRPGLVRLISALTPRPPFQGLVMSEESRLGREQIETAYLLKQLITAGVRVFYYLEDRERTLDSPTDKILLAVSSFADEVERDKARQRTYDAMRRRALTGHVTGGVVFGYENVPVLTPDGKRDHVARRILEPEAAVVRRIFALSAEGLGTRRIAHTLNARGPPRPGRAAGDAHRRGIRRRSTRCSPARCTGARSCGTRARSAMRGASTRSGPVRRRSGSVCRPRHFASSRSRSGWPSSGAWRRCDVLPPEHRRQAPWPGSGRERA